MKIGILLLFFLTIVMVEAQHDTDNPPTGYLDSCNSNPNMFDYFGPHCLNPVTWNVDGIIQQPYPTYEIGLWVYFTNDDGSTDGGVIEGYTWDFVTERYMYWVMVQMPFGNFGGAFDRIAPERVIQGQGSNL